MDKFRVDECNKAWQATLQGRYEEALRLYDRVLEVRRSLGEISNRALTRLLVGDLSGALTDFLEARQFSPGNRQEPFVGVVHWLSGDRLAAGSDWTVEIDRLRSGEVIYTDAAGGVIVPALLWWASVLQHDDQWRKSAVQELNRLERRKRCQQNWPGPVAYFLSKKITEAALQDAARTSKYPWAQQGGLRKCAFYIAAVYMSSGDKEKCRFYLHEAVSEGGSITNPEYHLARHWLKTM